MCALQPSRSVSRCFLHLAVCMVAFVLAQLRPGMTKQKLEWQRGSVSSRLLLSSALPKNVGAKNALVLEHRGARCGLEAAQSITVPLRLPGEGESSFSKP